MRAGPNWVAQQTLAAEAALVLRHSLGLARRRRHAQLTPLHVAAALLSSRPSLLEKACLRCRNQNLPPSAAMLHSVQSRALELCFNVALNRLPTTSSESLHNAPPVPLSNALIAALKRAQACQRRGCTEQNQTVASVKVELGQLIVSILDDPSVSRVLREAGFSSIIVKEHIEEYCSASTAATSVPPEGHGLSPQSFSFRELGIPLSMMRTAEVVELASMKCSPRSKLAKPFCKLNEHFGRACFEDCTSDYEKEVRLLKPQPFWLQPVAKVPPRKDEDLGELRKKWTKLCQSVHPHYQSRETRGSISFANPPRNTNIGVFEKCSVEEQSLDLFKKCEGKEVNTNLSLGGSRSGDDLNLGEKSAEDILSRGDLIKKLQENVPWHSEKIPSIVEALIGHNRSIRRDIWVMIEGDDTVGKRRLGFAIGESLLGSADSVIHFDKRVRSYGTQDLVEEMLRRRPRYGGKEKLAVVMVENVDLAGSQFVRFLEERFETGKFGGSSEGQEENEGQVLFILTKGDCCYNGRMVKPSPVISMILKANEVMDSKRKTESNISNKMKKQRIDDKEEPVLGIVENGYVGKDLLRQWSFNTIDLNVEVGEEEYEPEDSSPNSSDLTDPTPEARGLHKFLEPTDNRFTFNRSPAQDTQMKELLFSKLEGSFNEVYKGEAKVKFSADDSVLEEIVESSGFDANSLLENWMRDIFRTSLNIVRITGRGGRSVRLCLGDKQDGNLGEGFFSSSLPNKIRITFGE